MAVCFTVVGVQICLLDIKKFSSPNIWSTAKQAALSKKAFPETIKFRGGRLFCCPWCSDMFIGYTKAFFFQCMSDAKACGPIEKSKLLGIISTLQGDFYLTSPLKMKYSGSGIFIWPPLKMKYREGQTKIHGPSQSIYIGGVKQRSPG